MDKPQRMAQIYGYLVCLVAVITVIICVSSLIFAILDLADPMHAGFAPSGTPSLASYDNYRMDVIKSAPSGGEAGKSYIPDEKTLRAMYEAAKDDKIQRVRHESNRSIVIDSVLILICIGLFISHWRWLRKIPRVEA